MLSELFKQSKIAFKLLVFMTLLTGLVYPLLVTAIAQVFFHWRANGSLINQNGKWIGSTLIGQPFTDDKYFWSRPSATTPFPNNAANSSGSNFGPDNPAFLATVHSRAIHLRQSDPAHQSLLPVDLVTSSGSGLDPDISPLAAFYQVPRVAKARALSSDKIQTLVWAHIQEPALGFIGEPRVNVLELNMALDKLTR